MRAQWLLLSAAAVFAAANRRLSEVREDIKPREEQKARDGAPDALAEKKVEELPKPKPKPTPASDPAFSKASAWRTIHG